MYDSTFHLATGNLERNISPEMSLEIAWPPRVSIRNALQMKRIPLQYICINYVIALVELQNDH